MAGFISKRKSESLHPDSGCRLLPAPTAGWARHPELETTASTRRFHLVLPSGCHPAKDSQKKLFNRPPSTSQGPSGYSFHLKRKSELLCLASLPQSRPRCRSNHIFSFSKCIPSSCVKQITSPSSMHKKGCSGLAHWDNPEGWGFRMGDTCTPMADSCQCVAKTTTIL